MILTQRDGRAEPHVLLGATEGWGVATWAIEYEVVPKAEWLRHVPEDASASEEWATYRAIPFDPAGDRVRQEGIALVRFGADGLVVGFREWWDTKILR